MVISKTETITILHLTVIPLSTPLTLIVVSGIGVYNFSGTMNPSRFPQSFMFPSSSSCSPCVTYFYFNL